MSALTVDRNTAAKDIIRAIAYPVKGSTVIYDGALVMVVAGYAKPAADASGGKVVGVADFRADNSSGADGAIKVRVRRGVFHLDNADCTQADVGSRIFVSDDHTITHTDPTNHTKAGELLEIESTGGAWVLVDGA